MGVARVTGRDMREHQPSCAGFARHFGGFARRAVSRLQRACRFVVGERGLVNQQVGILRGGDGVLAGARVSGDHDTAAAASFAHQHRRLDHPTVVERDRLTLVNTSPERTLGDPHLARQIRIEATQSLLLHQRVAKRLGGAVRHRKRVDVVIRPFHRFAGLQLRDLDRKRGAIATKGDALTQRFTGATRTPQSQWFSSSL